MNTQINMTSSEFANKLNTGIYNIQFTKLDGAIRDMIATRKLDEIPEEQHPKTFSNEITDDASSVPVFDLKVCGWRSVRPITLTSIVEVSPAECV